MIHLPASLPMALFFLASLRRSIFDGSRDRMTSNISAKTMYPIAVVCMCHVKVLQVCGYRGCVGLRFKATSIFIMIKLIWEIFLFYYNGIRCRQYCLFQIPSWILILTEFFQFFCGVYISTNLFLNISDEFLFFPCRYRTIAVLFFVLLCELQPCSGFL